jgi:hypothetical protein
MVFASSAVIIPSPHETGDPGLTPLARARRAREIRHVKKSWLHLAYRAADFAIAKLAALKARGNRLQEPVAVANAQRAGGGHDRVELGI